MSTILKRVEASISSPTNRNSGVPWDEQAREKVRWHHPRTQLVLLSPMLGEDGDTHRREEANVPGDHVEPEGVAEAGALGEVGELGAHGLGELSEERATKRRHGDVRGDGPSADVCVSATSHALCMYCDVHACLSMRVYCWDAPSVENSYRFAHGT